MAATSHRSIKKQCCNVIVARGRGGLVNAITTIQIVGPLRRVATEHEPAPRGLRQWLKDPSFPLEKPVSPADVSQALVVEHQMRCRQDDVGTDRHAAAVAYIRLQLAVEAKWQIGHVADLIGRYRKGQIKAVR